MWGFKDLKLKIKMSKSLTWTLSKPPAEFHWNIEIPKCPIQKHDTRVSLQMVLVTPPPLLPCHRHNKDGNKNWFKPRVRAWALLIWPDFHHQLSEEETLAALATRSPASYNLRLPSCFHLNPHQLPPPVSSSSSFATFIVIDIIICHLQHYHC